MMETQDLKELIRDTIRTVLREERLTLWLALLPRVSNREMKAIETEFGKPTDYQTEEALDMTDWVRNGD
ncbi:hypothetical protein [Spirulina subsalsa]|nr:hypothetical protein [Spirulina subsalsa]